MWSTIATILLFVFAPSALLVLVLILIARRSKRKITTDKDESITTSRDDVLLKDYD